MSGVRVPHRPLFFRVQKRTGAKTQQNYWVFDSSEKLPFPQFGEFRLPSVPLCVPPLAMMPLRSRRRSPAASGSQPPVGERLQSGESHSLRILLRSAQEGDEGAV